MTDPRLAAAVDASRRWYDDLFALHGVPVATDGALWWALGPPPPWHSVVKTLVPTTDPGEVLRRFDLHGAGAVADSFGGLDLTGHGFTLLLDAAWVHHPGVSEDPRQSWILGPSGAPALPAGWSVVRDRALMARWAAAHDYAGVLPEEPGRHPRLTVLARVEAGELVGGAVLHDAGPVAGLSNAWGAEPEELLLLAAAVHPGRAVVDYAGGDELAALLSAGFTAVGPQRVWLRP